MKCAHCRRELVMEDWPGVVFSPPVLGFRDRFMLCVECFRYLLPGLRPSFEHVPAVDGPPGEETR